LIADVIGNPVEAERRLRRSYKARRNTLQWWMADGAACLASAGRKDEAMKVYKAFDEVAPRHPIVRTAMKARNENKPSCRS
jgi:Flp pilus assembly protein TadD